MSMLFRKMATAHRIGLKASVALIMNRLQSTFSRWCVILRQSMYSVPSGKRRLVVYLTPGGIKVNGGVMSIFNQAESSQRLLPDDFVVLSTYPCSEIFYATNNEFPNNSHIWRWNQIVRLMRHYKDVMIHVPDYYVERFYDDLSVHECQVLKAKRLAINIMDQNILMMPTKEKVDRLRELTPCLTQTCAHPRYSGQEFADKFNLPTLFLPAFWNIDCYPEYSFAQKEKRIVYSPDAHPRKQEILNMLKESFPDFEMYEVNGITFPKFMDIAARSMFSITFGEGADGYFSSPLRKHSMSFAVYNDDFFSKTIDWLSVWSVFSSYDDMKGNLVSKMRECISSESAYMSRVNEVRDAIGYVKTTDCERGKVFLERLARFYNNDFDYYPEVVAKPCA